MEFLYMLEKIRIPILNEFMLAITTLGEETAFLIIALVLFWCVDKYIGYYTLTVGFVGTITNQFMKLLFRIPRPWVLDSNFTILEQARQAATGYSFPSGHTQSAFGTFGCIAYTTNNKTLRIVAIIIPILVAFSRLYIGVHTPIDVGASILVALALIIMLRPIVLGHSRKFMPVLLFAMLLIALGFMCFVETYRFPADIDLHNYESGVENAYTLLGSLLGMLVVYIADEKWLKFPTKAVWWVQILKVVIGFVIVLIVKSTTKEFLNMLFGASLGRMIRYFLTVITAGIIWPMSFKWLSSIGGKE